MDRESYTKNSPNIPRETFLRIIVWLLIHINFLEVILKVVDLAIVDFFMMPYIWIREI